MLIIKGDMLKLSNKTKWQGLLQKFMLKKGTGNARHASRKAPIFVGGGIAHGPKGTTSLQNKKIK